MGRSTEEQVRLVARFLDREDEVNTSDVTSNKMGREPFARGPTMGRGQLAGGSVKSFNTNISTRGTKTPSVAGSRMSKNDARSVGSSKTPFAFSKQKSSKVGGGSVASSNTGNSPFANSKENSLADKPNPKKKTQ